MTAEVLRQLGDDQPMTAGIVSVCSSHELVIEASMLEAAARGKPLLLEATCNQVNHQGGYTGLTPQAFRRAVHAIADRIDFAQTSIIFGGDHLGPFPWRHQVVDEAMDNASAMVAAYAEAGFTKIHLDTSMACDGDDGEPPSQEVADRAARLASIAEKAATDDCVYVIGTEVPSPGGVGHGLDKPQPTAVPAVRSTIEHHRGAFARWAGEDVFGRVVALVVQPGVEFGPESVAIFNPTAADRLRAARGDFKPLVYEAHSTDYQPKDALASLVQHGFRILKVGPELTFALRQAIYGLDAIAKHLRLDTPSVVDTMELIMLEKPQLWQAFYRGTELSRRMLRHYGYSDRIRYFWNEPRAVDAVGALLDRFSQVEIPPPLISQCLPFLHDRWLDGTILHDARSIVIETVRDVLRRYENVIAAASASSKN